MLDALGNGNVAVAAGVIGYGALPPFSPQPAPPEYPFAAAAPPAADNPAYTGVRAALALAGLDAPNVGSPAWNPLGELIRPGDTVVLKPNFVRDFRESSPDHADCVMTHGSVIRAVADYAYIALRGRGRIIVADAPQSDANFERIRRIAGLDELQAHYRACADIDLEYFDLRPERAEKIDGVIVGHTPLPGDPAGYVRVDLGRASAFMEINGLCRRLYGSEYDTRELHRHQHDDVHEYLISRTVLEADVVISLPKLKTHKKVGLTVNLKNLVGINGNKNWLPHHRSGSTAEGGDEFADDGLKRRMERIAVGQFKRWFPRLGAARRLVAGPVKAAGRQIFGDTNTDTVRSGNWHGNDTTWRMVHDLNRVLLYSDREGRLHPAPVRRWFSIVDGVVAGEGNGPLDARPRPTGIIVAGGNPVAVDYACARLMGFDTELLPVLMRAFEPHDLPLIRLGPEQVTIVSNETRWSGPASGLNPPALGFEPHFGWRNLTRGQDAGAKRRAHA